MTTGAPAVSTDQITNSILLIRGQKVMLDMDLAQLYGVETRVLVQALRRNPERFPDDFMFQLTKQEFDDLRSQSVISRSWGGRRYPPYAFTEQGVAMLSSVLRSAQAARVNVDIMRAFVQLRELLATNRELAQRLDELEQRYDSQFKVIIDAIRQLMEPPAQPKRTMGFRNEPN